jgi:hypothetical protein
MKTRSLAWIVMPLIGATISAVGGCSSKQQLPIAEQYLAEQNPDGANAGSGLCWGTACGTGELCCPGWPSCKPTCLAPDRRLPDGRCPLTLEACVNDGGETDPGTSDASPMTLRWYMSGGPWPLSECGAYPADSGAACPPVGTSCTTKGDTCYAFDVEHCSIRHEICADHDP